MGLSRALLRRDIACALGLRRPSQPKRPLWRSFTGANRGMGSSSQRSMRARLWSSPRSETVEKPRNQALAKKHKMLYIEKTGVTDLVAMDRRVGREAQRGRRSILAGEHAASAWRSSPEPSARSIRRFDGS